MSNIDYNNITEIIVTNQAELDAIPDDFKGRIYIKCTTAVSVSKRYYSQPVAYDNSSVEAWDNSSVEARDNSTVEARGNGTVVARDNSTVEARGNGTVTAWGNSTVTAWGNSTVTAWGNSTVVANGNVQVVDRQRNGTINLSGNARKVHMPKNIHDFMDFYGINHNGKTAVFYKAVRKSEEGYYYSDRNNSFRYNVGETVTEKCDPDPACECSHGIHIAHLDWALRFGSYWDNLAILEVETDISDIVMPNDTDGKVRTSKVGVIREVPLEECGVYGKILAKKKDKI